MKVLKLLAFTCCLIPFDLFAQNPTSVEGDLYQSFKKIGYWYSYRFEHKGNADTSVNAIDSVDNANRRFGEKLKNYTAAYRFTLTEPFEKFNDTQLGIVSSDDGLFRIYSWDTFMGGTMRFYENVFQYKSGAEVHSILQKRDTSANGYIYRYTALQTFEANGTIYYLATYMGRFSTKDMISGIQVFSVQNGKLNSDVKLIKTDDGLQNKLSYHFNIFTINGDIKDKDIHFNSLLKTITLSAVGVRGKLIN